MGVSASDVVFASVWPCRCRWTHARDRRVPRAGTDLVRAATAFVSSARSLDMDKPPGLAEAIDWVTALQTLGVTRLDHADARATIGSIAKTPDDIAAVTAALDEHVASS